MESDESIFEIDDEGNHIYRNKENHLHRIDGPAMTFRDGEKHWYFHGKLHRDDGPASVYTCGTVCWYFHGKRHREDGPGRSFPPGTWPIEWWLMDREYSEQEHAWRVKHRQFEKEITDEKLFIEYKLIFG